MQRTISAMVGKGSVNHNSRKFKAENVDGNRTHLNIDYCNEPIRKVYHDGRTLSRRVQAQGSLWDSTAAGKQAQLQNFCKKYQNYHGPCRKGMCKVRKI